MVKIRKNNLVLKVTKGAYNSLFRNEGWELVPAEKAEKKADNKPKKEKAKAEEKKAQKPEIIEEKEELDDVEAPKEDAEAVTPLSEMTVFELKSYAKKHNIDIKDAKKAADIRKVIAAAEE